MPLVSNDGVAALRRYQYKGIDHGLLSNHFFQPWWRFCVSFLPMWLAPNTITLIALMFMVVAYGLSLFYTPTLTETAPTWVYIYQGIAMFAYMTLDAIDGKQARRTGSSSPLGELFDHGCDAVNTIFTVITTASALQLGGTKIYFWFCTAIYFSFFLAQWEEFHTHVMEFPLLGVTEGHVLYMTLMFVTAYFGPSFWSNTITLSPGNTITYGTGFVSLGLFGAFFGGGSSFSKVLECAPNLIEAIWRLAPVLLVHLPAIAWLYLADYFHATSPLAFPHLFELVRGFITAHVVGKTILARVTAAVFPYFPATVIPWAPTTALCILGVVPVSPTLQVYLLLTMCIYFVFATRMIRELCAILRIRAFHIVPKT